MSSLCAARAIALFTVGISLGGSMTYGQTLGLTQNSALIGNWSALGWGLLGVFVKGGIWIGLGTAFLGLGISGRRYRPWEILAVLAAMLLLFVLGVWLLNRPFDPAERNLPSIYFSADWYWEPHAELKPRPECWGGLLMAWVGLVAYLQLVRHDRIARNLAAIGFVAGGVGFALGQSVQACHAWNLEWFQAGPFATLDPHINWWNMMEIAFGATFAALLACGLWFQRLDVAQDVESDIVTVSPWWEGVLLTVYVVLLGGGEFLDSPQWELFLQVSLVMALLPIVVILGGRYGPYFYMLPIVMLPIAGKTLRELAYRNADVEPWLGWIAYVALPLIAATVAAWSFARRGERGQQGGIFARSALVLSALLYWGLNLAFFRFPWPWLPWTARTPSGIIFLICTLSLILAAIGYYPGRSGSGCREKPEAFR
jgi:hypothetical protein